MRKTNLKLVVHNHQNTVARPFETDYAGAWRGHCKTRASAVSAASKYLEANEFTRCTITDKRTGKPVVRMAWSRALNKVTIDYLEPVRRF